jgi:hypothetical protein
LAQAFIHETSKAFGIGTAIPCSTGAGVEKNNFEATVSKNQLNKVITTPKKKYEKPELVRYGTVQQLTRKGMSGSRDGGSFPQARTAL